MSEFERNICPGKLRFLPEELNEMNLDTNTFKCEKNPKNGYETFVSGKIVTYYNENGKPETLFIPELRETNIKSNLDIQGCESLKACISELEKQNADLESQLNALKSQQFEIWRLNGKEEAYQYVISLLTENKT